MKRRENIIVYIKTNSPFYPIHRFLRIVQFTRVHCSNVLYGISMSRKPATVQRCWLTNLIYFYPFVPLFFGNASRRLLVFVLSHLTLFFPSRGTSSQLSFIRSWASSSAKLSSARATIFPSLPLSEINCHSIFIAVYLSRQLPRCPLSPDNCLINQAFFVTETKVPFAQFRDSKKICWRAGQRHFDGSLQTDRDCRNRLPWRVIL